MGKIPSTHLPTILPELSAFFGSEVPVPEILAYGLRSGESGFQFLGPEI
jgi:hypothetical protein